MIPGDELLFLALGGSGEIGMNANLYGCRGKWILVDLGMTFADPAYPGVDLIFPDMTFIEERTDDLLGIVLTHGHEDHIGAIPYLAEELGVPLYATPFTAGLIARKLEEAGLAEKVELIVIENEGTVELGPFKCTYVPLAHSIAEGNALLIDTPYGRVFHTGDWKLDDKPLVGAPSTVEELCAIGEQGILALVCDSTNVFNPEASGSESVVRDSLLETVRAQKGRRVLVTTFASNVTRLDTLGAVARLTNRRLCVAGRSLDRIIATAKTAGYLQDLPDLIDMDSAMRLPRGEVLFVATGGQGEPRAALARISGGQHPIKLEPGDVVLFSSKTIPGNEMAIGQIQNDLAEMGVLMVTDRQADIHVSGHPGRPELHAMYGWIKPEIVVPVHGEIRHMQEQARFALECGVPKALFQKNGDVVRLAPGAPGVIGREFVGRLVLDGDVIMQADGPSVVARRRLGFNGLITVALAVGPNNAPRGVPVVQALGLPLDEDMDAFVDEAIEDVTTAMRNARRGDRDALREAVRLAVRRAATRWTGKKPVVQILFLEAAK